MAKNNPEEITHGITYNDELKLVWNVKDTGSRLLSEVERRDPWIGQYLDSINKCPVVATTCRKFEHAPYFRLPGHRRAFYICKKAGGGVIAVKGSELTAPDVDEQLGEFEQKRFSGSFYSMADYFVLREQKIPMAMMYQEALEEAEIALELHTAFYERYGELPNIPFPLSIFKWPDRDAEHFVENLRNYLCKRAFDLVRILSHEGLAVYYYYYPNTPIRVREIHEAMQAYSHNGYADRLAELSRRMKPEKVMTDWMILLVRMLGLGYVPVTLANDEIGQAVRAQNVVFDGGFADVGSFQKISDVNDELEVYESLWVTIIELTMSVRGLLAGGLGVNKVEHHDLSVVPFIIGCRIRDELLRIVDREKAGGISFDPGIESMLRSKSLFADLDRDLRIFYPASVQG